MFILELTRKIEAEYKARAAMLPALFEEIEKQMKPCKEEERLLLYYLYANMPLSDAVSYPFFTYLDYAAHSVFLWQEGQYRERVPEELFLQYVAFHRVNTEDISPCRRFFYGQLADRVKGLSMKEAVREVNYWCAEEASYQSTDERTASPMTVYRRGFGRCGEESAFTVSALRSAGIPSRQVYAHRWSHCDDNHAWVEAWCDGAWHFLGGCEPQELLDGGWFVNAASRAMMIHERCFGHQKPEGETVAKEGLVSRGNRLAGYADTVRLAVTVSEEDKSPAAGVPVSFQVLNYGELVPVAELVTGADGCVSLETGRGSLYVSAGRNGFYGACAVNVAETSACNLTLRRKERARPQGVWEDFDMLAPADAPAGRAKPTEEQLERGARKGRAAAKKREEKLAGFSCEDKGGILERSGGNRGEVEAFLQLAEGGRMKERLLSQLTDKDLCDCTAEMLSDHLLGALPHQDSWPEDIFVPYVLNPRIALEMLTPWRQAVLEVFTLAALYLEEPARIWRWIEEEITEQPAQEYDPLRTSVAGCLRFRTADAASKRVLFVAVCRGLGIPARLRPEDGAMEYYEGTAWRCVLPGEEKSARLRLTSSGGEKWVYMQNWSIGRWEDGVCRTLALGEGLQGEPELSLRPGEYRIITTNRLPNGNQFARAYGLILQAGQEAEAALSLREAALSDMLESIRLEDFPLYEEGAGARDASQIAGADENLFLWLEAGAEPTEHILNELCARSGEFASIRGRIILIVKEREALSDKTIAKAISCLPGARVCVDQGFGQVEAVSRRMYLEPDRLPLIIVTCPGLHAVYGAGGYSVGMADMLLRILGDKENKK